MTKFMHTRIRVSDLNATVNWYCDNLGFVCTRRTDKSPAGNELAFLELEGGNLELLQLLDEHNNPKAYPAPPIEEPYCPHLALATTDMDSLLRRLKREAIRIVKGPMEVPGLARWVYTCDPDNNIIEFVQWT